MEAPKNFTSVLNTNISIVDQRDLDNEFNFLRQKINELLKTLNQIKTYITKTCIVCGQQKDYSELICLDPDKEEYICRVICKDCIKNSGYDRRRTERKYVSNIKETN